MKEVAVALLELFAYLFATGVLTLLGAFAEFTSLSYLAAGNYMFAGWLVVVGGIVLYAGIVGVGFGKLLPGIRDVV